MPLVLADRVNETTTTTSTGTITLAGAVSGYQSFAVIGNGNTTYYTIVHQTANEWEVGIGTYTSSGTTLSRDTVLASSNSGSLVNFSAGTKFVFCDYPAGRAVYLDTATNVTIPGLTLSNGTANGVLYLNGSKVATSGSALTFDGTYFTANGLRLAGADVTNTIYQATGALGISTGSASGITFYTNLANRYQIDATGVAVWSVGGSESMRLNSTGLGIGTASPATTLHVNGLGGIFSQSGFNYATVSQLASSADAVFGGGVIADTVGGQLKKTVANDGNFIRLQISDGIAFHTGATGAAGSTFARTSFERMRLTAAGDLGIGTASPANYANYRNLAISGTTGANIDMLSGSTKVGNLFNDATNFYAYNVIAGSLVFGTNNTERMRLDSAGRFLLGASSNTSRGGSNTTALFYKASGTQYLDIQTGTSGDSGIVFSATSSSAYGLINYSNSVNAMLFYANSAEVFRITSSGLLGLGTTSPAAKLHVVNSTPNSGRPTALFDANYGNAGDTVTGLRLNVNTGAGGGYQWGYSTEFVLAHNMEFISGSNYVARATTASYLQQIGGEFVFFSNQSLTAGNTFTPTERMRLNSSGNLGIGTASPGARLDIVGDATPAGTGLAFGHANTAGYKWIQSFASQPLYINPLGNNTICNRDSGNVGIGTTSPAARLDVQGAVGEIRTLSTTGTNTVRNYQSNTGGQFYQGIDSSTGGNFGSAYSAVLWHTGNYPMLFATNNSERMRLNSTGLGISEGNNPTQVLSLYRSGSTNAIMSAGNSNTGLDGTWFGVDTAGNGIVNVRGAFPLLFSTSANERARITSAGDVIVNGTTVLQSAKLSVHSGSIAAENNGVDGTYENAFIGVYGANNNEHNVIQTAVSSSGTLSGFRFRASNGGGSSATTTVFDLTRWQTIFYTDGSERMRITSAGRLGVGTTTPRYAFQVNKTSIATPAMAIGGAFFGGPRLQVYDLDADAAAWMGLGTDMSGGIFEHSIYYPVAAGNGRLSFGTYDGTTYTQRMSLSQAGNLNVVGALSKGSGSFRIPHPLKEETHDLVHSFIEGPQADLIYSGKVQLEDGVATVNIDAASGMTEGTFVVLCRDIRCFTNNETDWDNVRGKVVGNLLTIECQNSDSNAVISWMVIGERQDKHMYDTDWTDENGKVIVEPARPVIKKGYN